MIGQHLGEQPAPEVPLHVDGTAFPLDTASLSYRPSPGAMDDLPSSDYATYLANTVKFHISQTYHIFDESKLAQTLSKIYDNDTQQSGPHSRLEYVQYLIVMALGKALLSRIGSNAPPPGSEYFKQAMAIFPDVTALHQDPILAVEICCGLALYLQSIDHRNSAYLYVGFRPS